MNTLIDTYEPLSTQMDFFVHETQARPLGNVGMDGFTERFVYHLVPHVAYV